jgi:magnesium-transporting ATPase (P-type)
MAMRNGMMTPDPNDAVEKHSIEANSGTTCTAETLPPPSAFSIPAKAKEHNIRVSSAVLDAAAKDGDALLQSLHTTPEGLTQAETEARARTAGPNEVAQERRRGWFVRLLIILRNPLVILLAALSSISFATGDAPRFWARTTASFQHQVSCWVLQPRMRHTGTCWLQEWPAWWPGLCRWPPVSTFRSIRRQTTASRML